METGLGTITAPRRTRGRPRQCDVELIDGALLDGALREFLRTGYGGTSIRQIVSALGISKTTLYSRYPSKEALFDAIVARQLARLSTQATLQADGEWMEIGMGLRSYANRTLELSLDSELRQVNLLVYGEALRSSELGAAAAERSRQGAAQIASYLSLCADRDGIPIRDPQGVAEAFIFMMRGWYVDVLLSGRQVSVAEREAWVERAVHAFLHGRGEW